MHILTNLIVVIILQFYIYVIYIHLYLCIYIYLKFKLFVSNISIKLAGKRWDLAGFRLLYFRGSLEVLTFR